MLVASKNQKIPYPISASWEYNHRYCHIRATKGNICWAVHSIIPYCDWREIISSHHTPLFFVGGWGNSIEHTHTHTHTHTDSLKIAWFCCLFSCHLFLPPLFPSPLPPLHPPSTRMCTPNPSVWSKKKAVSSVCSPVSSFLAASNLVSLHQNISDSDSGIILAPELELILKTPDLRFAVHNHSTLGYTWSPIRENRVSILWGLIISVAKARILLTGETPTGHLLLSGEFAQ